MQVLKKKPIISHVMSGQIKMYYNIAFNYKGGLFVRNKNRKIISGGVM